MASNGSHQNSDTEVFLAKTQLEGESKDKRNHDYVDDWFNIAVNVQNEIWRGKKLREKKPKPDETENEYFVPDINFFESFVNQPRVRKGRLETFKNNTSLCTPPRSRCPCTRITSAASTYVAINRISRSNAIQAKTQKGRRCPMRIAELAVPTKRQCIETWRSKSTVLPVFMVERLKQHVMDQTPIVKIPEAIYCFQSGRRMESKNCSFRWLSSKHKSNETQKPRHQSHQMDEKMLCILFAHKVAKRLSIPINLTLNSDLEKLSTIVSSDIAQIMSKCQCTSSKRRQYKAIHTDVSNKITVWITSILEDLSFKLLEEELRVKLEKETEAQIKIMLELSEQAVTIIDTIIGQEIFMKSEDLEEEEGPVLDFIDDLVETVMNICEPPQLHIESDSSGSTKDILLEEESDKPIEPIESSDNKMSKLEEIFNSVTSTQLSTEQTDDSDIDSNENLTDSEHFRNEISNIIDYIITKESGDDNMSNGSGDEIENGSGDDIENEEVSLKAEMEHNTNDENNEGNPPEAGIEHDVNEEILPEAGIDHDENNDEILLETEKKQDIKDENNVGISPEAGIEHDINDETFDQIDENSRNVDENDEASDNAAETHSNVSERFEIFTDDSDDDKNSKKVVFPKKDLVNPDNPVKQILTSTAEEPALEPDEHKRATWNLQNNKSNIMFAEPNHNLLSDADESWPAELGDKPMLKVSESASKSVSSLGRITENDEMQMSSPEDEDSMTDKGTDDTILQVNDIMEQLDNMLPTEKNDTASQPNEPQIQVYLETSTKEPDEKQVVTKIINEKVMSKTITVPKTHDDKHDTASQPNEPQIQVYLETSTKEPDEKQVVTKIINEKVMSKTITVPKTHDDKHDTASQPNEPQIQVYLETSTKEPDEKQVVTKIINEKVMSKTITVPKTHDDKHDTASQPNEQQIQVYLETSTKEPDEKQVVTKIINEKVMSKTITVPKTHDVESSKLDKYLKYNGENELIRTGSTTDRTEDDKIPSHKSQSQVDYGWKVHPKTAPSWVMSWGQGRGEPSEDSIPIQIRPIKVKEIEVRNWCKDLEKAFTNLEMWSNWISATCKESIFVLQQKELKCPALAQKRTINWIRLQKNVHKDALLWTKLYQRTDKNFKSLKEKYNNIEVTLNKVPSVLNRTIFEMMREFEELSVKLHRMIVAAECYAMCTCDQTKSRYHSIKDYLGLRTK